MKYLIELNRKQCSSKFIEKYVPIILIDQSSWWNKRRYFRSIYGRVKIQLKVRFGRPQLIYHLLWNNYESISWFKPVQTNAIQIILDVNDCHWIYMQNFQCLQNFDTHCSSLHWAYFCSVIQKHTCLISFNFGYYEIDFWV